MPCKRAAKLEFRCRPSRLFPVVIPTLLACASDVPHRMPESLSWSVDTLAVIGVESGNPDAEFGRLIAGALGPNGEVFLLDLLLSTISVFDGEGRALSAIAVGPGPGEVRQPWAMSLDAHGRLAVIDLGNGRKSRFEHDRGNLAPLGSVPLRYPAQDLCLLGDRVVAGLLHDEMMAHELNTDGEVLASFGEAPPLVGIDRLGPHATHARREILIDPERGANFVRSMVRWDGNHLLIQYEVRRSDTELDDREFHGIDSRLIALDAGEEVARTSDLPLLAAARDERFLIIENVPFPRAFVVERR